jgi:hypothetical protein
MKYFLPLLLMLQYTLAKAQGGTTYPLNCNDLKLTNINEKDIFCIINTK